MKYLGGKARLVKYITPFLIEALKAKKGVFYEPFVGGFNIVPTISEHIKYALCSDTNKSLITLYKALQDGWTPPSKVSETTYKKYKDLRNSDDPLTAFIAFGCSFGGKEWGGYARDKKKSNYAQVCKNSPQKKFRNYALESKNNLANKQEAMIGITFSQDSYQKHCPKNAVVYCDPPYINTTGYKTSVFDHKDFFLWCEQAASKGCIVFISEKTKPRGRQFKVIWSKTRKVSLSSSKEPKTLKELLIKVVL